MRQAPGSTPPLLERADDLAAVERVVAEAGRVVLVEGPAGIGKTSLLGSWDAPDVEVLRARGAQLEEDYGWGVIRQLFEGWLRDRPPAERRRLLAGAAGPARAALGEAGDADEQPSRRCV